MPDRTLELAGALTAWQARQQSQAGGSQLHGRWPAHLEGVQRLEGNVQQPRAVHLGKVAQQQVARAGQGLGQAAEGQGLR
jgi:hypothetical protein